MSKEINRLRQQLHRQKQREGADKLPPHQKHVALAIYILGGHSAGLAAEYCVQQHPRLGHDWVPTIEEWYLQSSEEQLVAYEMPERKRDVRAHNVAKKWLAEQATAVWVQNQNYSKGVAPASSDLADRYVATLGAGKAGAVAIGERATRRFCQRFRARWHIRLGVLKVREAMPEAILRQKAGRE
jgi:hypothetical protein